MRNLAVLFVVFAAACSPASEGGAQDEAARHAAEMAVATREARAKLGYFWAHAEAPEVDEYDFTLKAALPREDGEEGEEIVWVEDVVRAGDMANGALFGENPE